MRQAQVVKKGVASAKGTPREFLATIHRSTDGSPGAFQGRKASLARRDLIADSVELTMRGNIAYDAIVGPAVAYKSLHGLMMVDGPA